MRYRTFLGLAVAFLLLGAAVTQITVWRTGRVAAAPLDLTPGGPPMPPATRLWIDTDAACGAGNRVDPDDCLAILWVVAHQANIVGLSTSFGNASGAVVAQTVTDLTARMAEDGLLPPPVFIGHAEPAVTSSADPPGVLALRAALQDGPLIILALGPLTNLAAALDGRPDLQANVTRIVAVMGHRRGHLFHPGEGHVSGAFLGHGPIFRDLNFSVDPQAARQVLAMALPMTLIPYDAGRGTLITGPDLDQFARQGKTQAWLASTAQDWLGFWHQEVGLPGFYPFDWVAAASLSHPEVFDCTRVSAEVATEWAMWLVPRTGLLIDPPDPPDAPTFITYCPQTSPSLHGLLLSGSEPFD